MKSVCLIFPSIDINRDDHCNIDIALFNAFFSITRSKVVHITTNVWWMRVRNRTTRRGSASIVPSIYFPVQGHSIATSTWTIVRTSQRACHHAIDKTSLTQLQSHLRILQNSSIPEESAGSRVVILRDNQSEAAGVAHTSLDDPVELQSPSIA